MLSIRVVNDSGIRIGIKAWFVGIGIMDFGKPWNWNQNWKRNRYWNRNYWSWNHLQLWLHASNEQLISVRNCHIHTAQQIRRK